MRLQRQMSAGFRLLGSYKWGKAIDTSPSVAQTDFDDSDRMRIPYNVALRRGLADFDVRHTFNANASWQIRGGCFGDLDQRPSLAARAQCPARARALRGKRGRAEIPVAGGAKRRSGAH